jgi:hypothetical protein
MLQAVAVHRLVVGPPAKAQYIGAAHPDQIEPAAAARLQSYIDNLVERSEGRGRAQAAWWKDGPPSELEQLLSCDVKDFEKNSRSALDRLVSCTPPTAQSGVIVFVRDVVGETHTLTCLKMLLSREQLARFQDAVSADQAIHVEDIDNILPEAKELKKAALVPHPTGVADLRVVDEQMDAPANYWMDFLGAHARRKEPEVAKLAVVTASQVLRDRGLEDSQVAASIGASLEEAIATGKEEEPQTFVKRVAEMVNVPGSELWSEVAQQQPRLTEPEARVTPPAAELVKTTITLEHDIKVSGPSRHLDTRFTIEPAEGDEQGWIVRLRSAEQPTIRRTIATGRS